MFLKVSSFFGKVIDVVFLFSFVVSEWGYKGCGLVLVCYALMYCMNDGNFVG